MSEERIIGRTLLRLIVVPLAFLVSGLAALFVLFTLGLERITQALHRQDSEWIAPETLFSLIEQGGLLLSGLTLIPALGVVIIGEVARIRSAIFYILGGGAALAAIPLIARIGAEPGALMGPAIIWQVFATAGFAGGLVYWLMAGRRA